MGDIFLAHLVPIEHRLNTTAYIYLSIVADHVHPFMTTVYQKGVQPGTSKVYLIKWPVNVCIYTCIFL